MSFKRHHQEDETEEVKKTEQPETEKKPEEKQPAPVVEKPEMEVIEKVKLPEVKKPVEKKKRVDKKTAVNVGIVGDTIEVRDFRAIVKKKGLQINTVLTELLHGWNTNNYNL